MQGWRPASASAGSRPPCPGSCSTGWSPARSGRRAVNSFNESYFTLLEFADFLDLQEICQAHPKAAGFLKALGGNPQVWQARFLELQTLRDKLAGLRESTRPRCRSCSTWRVASSQTVSLGHRPIARPLGLGEPRHHSDQRLNPTEGRHGFGNYAQPGITSKVSARSRLACIGDP